MVKTTYFPISTENYSDKNYLFYQRFMSNPRFNNILRQFEFRNTKSIY